MKRFLADETATLDFATQLAPSLVNLNLVTFKGDLGTGKTTLVRGILKALNYTGRVKSPTYTLVEPYQIGDKAIFHFDLYRLAHPEELEYIGFADYFDDQALCLVEWPEKAAGWLPASDLAIEFKAKASGREVSLIPHSEKGRLALDSMKNDN